MLKIAPIISLLFCFRILCSQNSGILSGTVHSNGQPVPFVTVGLKNTTYGASTNTNGYFEIKQIAFGTYEVVISAIGYAKQSKSVTISNSKPSVALSFELKENQSNLEEVVVSGTMKEVSKTESPVPVEVYTPALFKKNPTPSIFDALQNVNGVRPQLNCNVCNTGDIHINGLEGPYTMIMIDGMPIVSGLSSVYGLSGIPNSLVERIEIVKGPASSLYGSEAVGGLINIITKKTANADKLSLDVMATSYQEYNVDAGFKYKPGKKADALLGVNYYNYQKPVDHNNDGFTDVTLQHRISVFNKLNFERKDNREASVALRYYYEDRWGGDMKWNKNWRGTDSIYGESIFTGRYEVIGKYQLPIKERIFYNVSFNSHDQNSYYGKVKFYAQQKILFNQLYWEKELSKHSLLAGVAYRYTWYDDNTVITQTNDTINPKNKPNNVSLPGVFIQDEIKFNCNHKLLVGFRYDYNEAHGNIYTPRVAYKWTLNAKNILRLNAGTGYRVANVFSEDHAALTGSREVIVVDNLKPEQSVNANLNYVTKFYKESFVLGIDMSAFYTRFSNRIIADYDTDPNKIYFNNLNGYAISQGASANIDLVLQKIPLKLLVGGTYMDNYKVENGTRARQILTEHFTGTWALSYEWKKMGLSFDYTGNIYSPMRLPLLGPLDPRKEYSPWWSIQNIQITKKIKCFEIYGGVKNLLNFTPPANSIARSFDPFDKGVQYNSAGQIIATPNNPYAQSFDPTYMFAPNQGIRGFLGLRFKI
ncbi:MAG: carboxypeptidase-like regulatory domain-containing protein [Bacteroidetes bacterium]|nr:carboxypeptidase-like regulatory domain-containing protein [Bacteroidota bacterium]